MNLRDLGSDGRVYASYQNVPEPLAVVMSARLATLHELDTVYGARDLYDMLEIVTVDAYNQALANKPQG